MEDTNVCFISKQGNPLPCAPVPTSRKWDQSFLLSEVPAESSMKSAHNSLFSKDHGDLSLCQFLYPVLLPDWLPFCLMKQIEQWCCKSSTHFLPLLAHLPTWLFMPLESWPPPPFLRAGDLCFAAAENRSKSKKGIYLSLLRSSRDSNAIFSCLIITEKRWQI